MLDYRTEEEKKSNVAYVVTCNSCGRESVVGESHGRYCPYCGPDTITPVHIKKVEGKPGEGLHIDTDKQVVDWR